MATLKDLTDLMASSNLTEAQIADLISTLTVMQKENKASKRGKKVVLSAELLGQHRTIAEASAVESPIRQETIGFPAHFFARAHNFKPPGRACQPEADSPMRT